MTSRFLVPLLVSGCLVSVVAAESFRPSEITIAADISAVKEAVSRVFSEREPRYSLKSESEHRLVLHREAKRWITNICEEHSYAATES